MFVVMEICGAGFKLASVLKLTGSGSCQTDGGEQVTECPASLNPHLSFVDKFGFNNGTFKSSGLNL